jgi:hypothetical protein
LSTLEVIYFSDQGAGSPDVDEDNGESIEENNSYHSYAEILECNFGLYADWLNRGEG